MLWSVTINKKYDRRYFFVTAGMRELISKELVVSAPDMFSIEKEVRACKACRIQPADVQGEHECIEACDMRNLPEREISDESETLRKEDDSTRHSRTHRKEYELNRK